MYTKREAAESLGIDRNTLNKWLRVCGITPATDPRDKRLCLLSDDDLLTLRERYAESHRAFNGASVHPLVSSADLDELRAQVAELQQQVAALTARRSASILPTGLSLPDYEPPRRLAPSTASHSHTSRPQVPTGMMALPTWVRLHGMKQGTVEHWRDVGKLPMVRGAWMEGNSRIGYVMTIEGRKVAHQLAHLPWPCEKCSEEEADNETPHTAEGVGRSS